MSKQVKTLLKKKFFYDYLFMYAKIVSAYIGDRNTFLSLKLIFHFERFRILSLLSTLLF